MSAGTENVFIPSCPTSGGPSRVGLVVTTTAHCALDTPGELKFGIQDFTWWVLPE